MTRSTKSPGRRQKSDNRLMSYDFPLVIEQDEDGFVVSAPTLQGCFAQGDTYEEAMANIADALKLHIEDRLANKEPLPVNKSVSVSVMHVVA